MTGKVKEREPTIYGGARDEELLDDFEATKAAIPKHSRRHASKQSRILSIGHNRDRMEEFSALYGCQENEEATRQKLRNLPAILP